ncbi:MAG: M23 family metallopeptidase [Acidobacteria bacterium]|nr:M23 family metallopeptidase [Acidobacteriota bacterium]
MTRAILAAVAVAALAAGGYAWFAAGQAAGPAIEIRQPERFVGRTAVFEATVDSPDGRLTALDAFIEQDGSHQLFALEDAGDTETRQETATRLRLVRRFDRESHPELRAGPATVVVRATRPVLFGLRETSSETSVAVEVRLDPPRLTPLSRFHYVNHGGAEFIVYRVAPNDVESGVEVGDRFYPGYDAAGALAAAAASGVASPLESAGAGLEGGDGLRVALFALAHDQDLGTPMRLYARDPAGNEARAPFDHRVFDREFRRSRIQVGEGFLRRVVPAIAANAPELADEEVDAASDLGDLLDLYLFVNGELRRRNSATVAALAAETEPRWLWQGPFRQLANSQVESGFADHRTYFHAGDEIDQQVHLGFDLASTANAPIRAANAGRVIFADYLGIFGNCVVVDHGMGLQSLYAHLSTIDVAIGDAVAREDTLGLSGQTGLAGGDHLHFTMLLHGEPVTPVEWWDEHWIEDRILRKLREAPAADGGGP